jgi:raffinose/stachyose/melibiose transport system permease protein
MTADPYRAAPAGTGSATNPGRGAATAEPGALRSGSARKHRTRRWLQNRMAIPKQAVLLLAALLVLLPTYFMLITPFKTQIAYGADKLGFPQSLYLENFVTAMRGGRFFQWFGNSVIMVVGGVGLSTVVSALAAFAFARMEFPGRNPVLSVVTSLMVIPPVVMMIPLFLFYSRLDLTSTYPSAIIVYAGLVTPFAVYMLTNFFQTIPHEIIESSLIDGASSLGVLTLIVVPLSAPALITLIVVNTLWVWNDLLVALVLLPDDRMRTLMVGITVFGARYNADVPVALAGMIVASLPMLLLYIFGQRYFTQGLVAGALKG